MAHEVISVIRALVSLSKLLESLAGEQVGSIHKVQQQLSQAST